LCKTSRDGACGCEAIISEGPIAHLMSSRSAREAGVVNCASEQTPGEAAQMSKQHTRLPGNEDPDRRAATHAGAEGQDVAALPTEHLQTLARTLQKRHEELEAENEALRETRFELALARDRYYSLYEFAPVGYLTLDSDGRIVEANITAATILGVER